MNRTKTMYIWGLIILCLATFLYLKISILNVISILLIVGGTFYSALLIHELGHLIVGLCLGYRLKRLVVAPLILEFNPSVKIRFQYSATEWALCVMQVLLPDYKKGRVQYILYLAGGSIANFVVVAISLYVYITSNLFLAIGIAFCHFVLGILAILPIRGQHSSFSDGYGIQILSKNDSLSRFYYDLLLVTYARMDESNKIPITDTCIDTLYEQLLVFISGQSQEQSANHPLFPHAVFTLTTELIAQQKYEQCIHLIERAQANQIQCDPWQEEMKSLYSLSKASL